MCLCRSPGVTTTTSRSDTVRPPVIFSVSVTVQLALPNLLATRAKVRLPVTALIAGGVENRLAPGTPDRQLTVNSSGSISPGPDEMLVAQAAL